MTLSIYDGKDFARQFRVVRNNTLQIAQDIPESNYGFVPAPDCRAIGALLTLMGKHVVDRQKVGMMRASPRQLSGSRRRG